MKRILFITSLLALFLISADPVKQHRLTIINKSGMDLGIRLMGVEDSDLYYYLTIEDGDRTNPTTKTFHITSDVYNMQLYYIETWDPVYGYKCNTPPPNRLAATRNLKVVFDICDQAPTNPGEPSMMKYWPAPPDNPFWFKYWRCRYIY